MQTVDEVEAVDVNVIQVEVGKPLGKIGAENAEAVTADRCGDAEFAIPGLVGFFPGEIEVGDDAGTDDEPVVLEGELVAL